MAFCGKHGFGMVSIVSFRVWLVPVLHASEVNDFFIGGSSSGSVGQGPG